MDESLADLGLFASLVVPTVSNTLFPPLQSEDAEQLEKVLFLDDSASGYRLTRRHLLQTSHAVAKAIRDNRGVAYAWAPFRKGDCVGVVLPGENEARSGMPLGWEWSMLEAVIACLGILKAGGTVRLYRAQENLADRLKQAAEAVSAHRDVSLWKDLTVPESPSTVAPRTKNQPPHHPVPPQPRIFVTPPTIPIPHVPNLFYGSPEIPESVAWRNATRPMMDLCERGALLRDEILPSLITDDAERWAIWSEEEGAGMKHYEVVEVLNSSATSDEATVQVDPVDIWRCRDFVEGVLVPIMRGQTAVFLQPGKSREDNQSKL